jgi:hypothetical protein
MDSGCWFNLPDGTTAKEMEVTIPVKGRISVPASIAVDFDRWRCLLLESMRKQSFSTIGTLDEMFRGCLIGYENLVRHALAGSESVRNDMHVMLRSVVFVLETVVTEHINHTQKNDRISGAIALLERHIARLREEQFDFHGYAWQRGPDLFRWNETERRLRERVRDLEGELRSLTGTVQVSPDPQTPDSESGDGRPF